MKFSVIFEAQLVDPTPARERRVIHDCVEQAQGTPRIRLRRPGQGRTQVVLGRREAVLGSAPGPWTGPPRG
ncbi:hypothetical protein ABT154_06670 [Streptomyces sp. NPDC001728]|uniref:hypothetical protein n=1 Tax=Streptomyces sp. NPDC001728 TaxID=3154396 RepID=UPI003333F6AE